MLHAVFQVPSMCVGLQVLLFFQRAASPSLLGRMVESAMPLLGVENEGKVNACPQLIAATGHNASV